MTDQSTQKPCEEVLASVYEASKALHESGMMSKTSLDNIAGFRNVPSGISPCKHVGTLLAALWAMGGERQCRVLKIGATKTKENGVERADADDLRAWRLYTGQLRPGTSEMAEMLEANRRRLQRERQLETEEGEK